ncbi:PAS domain-containing protein [Chondromyces apiculatus]|uniref:RsbR, positive regulator of sigma-B n=1 Tax=Chondromyces apiculatus DSM 436 TaxID=1192034 RepID=A0A017T1K9_9BACT|nr:PAS domain-containing protein [Chondromyces apiculatus]EYF03134.1 RsbR, positive regulator of sigma-B [Chondromyces apiculatus DSM 436]
MQEHDRRDGAEGAQAGAGEEGRPLSDRVAAAWMQGWAHYYKEASDLLCVSSAKGFFLDLNPAWERALGYSVAEMCRGSFLDLIHPDDLEHSRQALARVAVGDTALGDLVNRYRRKDGTYASIAWKSVVMVGELCYCMAQDVSAQEETEAILRKERARLHQLQHASGVVLYAIGSLAGGMPGITFISDNLRDVLGYKPEEFFEDRELWNRMVHPDDLARALDGTPIFAHGFYLREYRFRHKDGSYRWMRDETKLVKDAEGRPFEAVGTWQDVTERKEVEHTLQQQENALLELSTPLIPISDEILVMPLIGMVDSRRAEQIMSTILDGITARRAKVAILDITGMGSVDTKIAELLLRTARAARLLGVEVLLTGIRPDVAQTLVTLGVDLGAVVTFGTLQAGIQHAMRRSSAPSRR